MTNKNNRIDLIMDTLSYVERFYGKTILIKLGGSILHNEHLIQSMCDDLKLLKGVGIKIVIVHGGSRAIDRALKAYKIESKFIDGLRVTSKEAIKIIEMVLSGHVNRLIVRKLNSIKIRAVGLTGSDDNMLQCKYLSEEHGNVGLIVKVNVDPINNLLYQARPNDLIPVIAPIGVDDSGNPLNINADFAASQIASSLQVNKLIYLTDQDGVYDDKGQIFSRLSKIELEKLIENRIVRDGMEVKARAILSALNSNLNNVHILNGNKSHILISELFTVQGVGTLCYL